MKYKKTLFILAVIFVLVLIVLVILFKKSSPEPQTGSMETTTSTVKQDTKSEGQNINKTPNAASSTTSVAAIKDAFNKFASSTPSNAIEFVNLTDSNKKNISLQEFSQAINLNINPQIKQLLDLNKFDLFACPPNNGNKEIGLVIEIRLLSDYQGNLYSDEISYMKNWEKTMFNDTRSVLFPDINFTPELLKQNIVFKDGKHRYAQIVLPGNTAGFLEYELVDDFVVISNSSNCLNRAVDQLFDTSD